MMDEVPYKKKWDAGLFFGYVLVIIFLICFISIPIAFWLVPLVSGNEVQTSDISETYYYDFDNNNSDTLEWEQFKQSNIRLQQESSGIYNATYSFENGELYDFDYFNDPDTSYGITNFNGHDDVLYLNDASSIYDVGFNESFTENQEYGTIEYWVAVNDTYKASYFIFISAGQKGYLRIRYDSYRVYEDAGVNYELKSVVDDEWIHTRIDFECTSGGYMGLINDTYRVFVNGNYTGTYEFYSDIDYLEDFQFQTKDIHFDYKLYIDAIGFSWESYENGSNWFPLMENTTTYEVDEQCFHQIDYEATLEADYTSGDDYVDGYLDWNVAKSTGYVKVYEGSMINPELVGTPVYNIDNYDVVIGAVDVAPDYTQFYRNFGNFEYDVMEFTVDFKIYFDDQYDSAVLRLYDGSASGIPLFFCSADATNDYDIFLYDSDLDSHEIISDVSLLNHFQYYCMVSNNLSYHYFYDIYSDTEYEMYLDIGLLDGNFTKLLFEVGASSNAYMTVDDIGVYAEGISLIDNEWGYIEHYAERMSNMERAFLNDLEGGTIYVSNTHTENDPYGYLITDDMLTSLFNQTSGTNDYDLDLTYDSLILALSNESTMENTYELGWYNVYIRNNSVYETDADCWWQVYAHNESYVYSQDNKLNVYVYSWDAVFQGVSILFEIDSFDTTNTTLYVNEVVRSNWMFKVEIEVYFTDGNFYSFYMDDSESYTFDGSNWKGSFAGYVPHYKTVDYFNITLLPNGNAIDTFLYFSLDSIEFRPRYQTPFDLDNLHDTGILSILVPIIALLTPSFIIPYGLEQKRKGMAKKTFIPVFLIFTIILFATSIIPMWLFFVCLVASGTLIFVMSNKARETTTNINLGLSLQAKKDKLATAQKKKKARDFKSSFKYQMAKYKALEKRDKYQKKQYRKATRKANKDSRYMKKMERKYKRFYKRNASK